MIRIDNPVYYSQEDSRWRNELYSNHRDPGQTIATSGCGPTSLAMVVSSLLQEAVLPPVLARYSIDNGFRTFDNGTDWGFFRSAAEAYSLSCKQTGSIVDVKQALAAGALVIASMRTGHFTSGGHYVVLTGIKGVLVDVYDPNPDNRRYGGDGLILGGSKNDGKVTAHSQVFVNEAAQYWIFPIPEKTEAEENEVTREEYEELNRRMAKLEEKKPAPAWFVAEFGSADLDGKISEPSFTSEGWRVIAVAIRAKKS